MNLTKSYRLLHDLRTLSDVFSYQTFDKKAFLRPFRLGNSLNSMARNSIKIMTRGRKKKTKKKETHLKPELQLHIHAHTLETTTKLKFEAFLLVLSSRKFLFSLQKPKQNL